MNHVSIIMGAYNEAANINISIESIRKQSYPNWELIVVNDASTDETGELLKSIAMNDERIKIITNNINRGLAKSLNIALNIAVGVYIARMDADDIALPERLEKQVNFLDQHTDITVLGAGSIDLDDKGNKGKCRLGRKTHEDMVKHIFTENPFSHPTVMARNFFFKALNGYDEQLRRAQDYDLWLRGYRHFLYHNLQEPLICYMRDKRPNFRNAVYSSFVILKAIARDKKPPLYVWYAIRPLLATFLGKKGSQIIK